MRFQKWFIGILLVSLVFSFSVYGKGPGHGPDHGKTKFCNKDKDAVVKDITKIIKQLQGNDFSISEKIFAENILWKYEGVAGTVPFAGTYQGQTGVKTFWKIYLRSVLPTKADLRYALRQGNILHLHWTEEGVVKSTGKRYAMETVQRWEFNDEGEIVKLRWYNDTYALYNAFLIHTNPRLSLALHPADYYINGNGPVDAAFAVQVVQRYYYQFSQGDIQGMLSNVPNNVVFILAGPEGLTKIAGTWTTPQGLIGFFTTLAANEWYNKFQLLTFTVDGNRVDVEFEEEIGIFETGKVTSCAGLHSFVVLTNGQVAKFRSYNDTYPVAWTYIP